MTTMTMEELSKKLSKIDFCMFNTNGGSGRINSRPIATTEMSNTMATHGSSPTRTRKR